MKDFIHRMLGKLLDKKVQSKLSMTGLRTNKPAFKNMTFFGIVKGTSF